MTDSNKTIILALVTAIIISLGGTVIVLNKLEDLSIRPIFSGMATSDTGFVNVTILSSLSIDVNDTEDIIDFGTCNVPPAGTNVTLISNNSESWLNDSNNGVVNCTTTNMRAADGDEAFITIHNIGNADAQVNISSNIDANSSAFLTSSQARMRYGVRNKTAGDCLEEGQHDWNMIVNRNTEYKTCERLDTGATYPAIQVYINLTVPFDSSTGGVERMATLTFSAIETP